MGLISGPGAKPPRLPRWKKLAFSLVVLSVLGLATYVLGEIAYRRAHDIPVSLSSPPVVRDGRALADHDTSVMDFASVHYYEIFAESKNPGLYYEPRPGFSKGAVRINSHGFRDREFAVQKPKGTRRVVVLGDSIVWGHGLLLQDTFAKQLETLLAQRAGGDFEVLNFGVSGYSLQQEAEFYLTRAIRFDPDVAIIGFSVNDFFYSSVEGDFFQSRSAGIFDRSYLTGFLSLSANYVLHRYFRVAPSYLQRIVDVRYHLQRLQAASPGVRWMVLMFPHLVDLRSYRYQWHHDTLTAPARGLGFVVRDLLEDFRRFPPEKLRLDHIHPSGFGNQVAAEAAYETLVAAQLIPRAGP